MAYFKPMGSVWHTLPNGEIVLLNDVTVFADFPKLWKDDARVQLQYVIRDGELPHMISDRLYGSVELWWTILKVNDIYDLENQWPRSQSQLSKYIASKYPGKTLDDIHHYVNAHGLVADLLSLRYEMGLTSDSQVIN